MQTLQELKDSWVDTPEFHHHVNTGFAALTTQDEALNAHRSFVEANAFGFGERSFAWLWKLVLQELPDNPKLLEIGVFKGQTISLWKMLKPKAKVYGITPLNSAGGVWESDYAADIKHIHERFGLDQPTIIKEYSQDEAAIEGAKKYAPFDVVYVDGGHTYEIAHDDLTNYAPMVKKGGYLVVDDAANHLSMPFGYFQGINSVTDALLGWQRTTEDFEFICNVVHLMVFKRVK